MTPQLDFDFIDLIYKMKPGSIIRTVKDVSVFHKNKNITLPSGSQCVVTKLVMGDVNAKAEMRKGLWEVVSEYSNVSWMVYGDEMEILYMIKAKSRPWYEEDWYY